MTTTFRPEGSVPLPKSTSNTISSNTHVALLVKKYRRDFKEPKDFVKMYPEGNELFRKYCSLQGRERELLSYLMNKCLYDTSILLDSNAAISLELNITTANISRYMKTLVDAGAVLKIDKRRHLNPYLAYRGDWSKLDEKVKAVGEAQLSRWKEKALGSSVERNEEEGRSEGREEVGEA